MIRIRMLSARQLIVLRLKPSEKIICAMIVKTIMPIVNQINRLGQMVPSNAITKCLTEFMKSQEIGRPIKMSQLRFSFANSHFNGPCN